MKAIMDSEASVAVEMTRSAVPRYLMCKRLYEIEITLTQAVQAYMGPNFDGIMADLMPVAVAKVITCLKD